MQLARQAERRTAAVQDAGSMSESACLDGADGAYVG